MRRILFAYLFLIHVPFLYSQEVESCDIWDVNFEEPILDYCTSFFTINDGLDSGGVWQIGPPQKETLNFAYSGDFVIITDSVNPYPVNDTSSFTIHHVVDQLSLPGGNVYAFAFRGAYFAQLDDGDECKMEYSINQGESWYDLINADDLQSEYYITWHSEIPDFSVHTAGWELFDLEWSIFLKYEESGQEIMTGDTIQIRFSLISVSIPGNAEGIMFDSFTMEQYAESVFNTNFRAFDSTVQPNPTKNSTEILFSNPNSLETTVSIFNQMGREVQTSQTIDNRIAIDLKFLQAGIYTYRLLQEDEQRISRGKIVKVE